MAVEATNERRYRFAEFELDLDRRRLLRNDQIVVLNSRAFELLRFLVEKKGEIVSKDEILESVWAGQFVEEGNLPVHISALRKLLGEGKKDNRFIVTVPGRGYGFVADLTSETESQILFERHSLSKIVIEEEIAEYDSDRHLVRRSGEFRPHSTLTTILGDRSRMIAALILIALLGITGFFLLRRDSAKRLFRVENRTMRRLTSKGNVERGAISPDGKLYAFSQAFGDKQSLWLGHVDGGEPVQIIPPTDHIFWSILFSPDAGSIYFTESENHRPGTLKRIPVFGGVPENIKDNVRNATLSPDGKQFAYLKYVESAGRLFVAMADIDGGNERDVASVEGGIDSDWHNPAWSPDGSTIAISVTYNYDETRLFTINIPDGAVRQLGTTAWNQLAGISWVKGGNELIAIGADRDSYLPQLWSIAFPGGEARRLSNDLTTYNGFTSLANDNSLLTVDGVSQSNIWVASAANLSSAKQVTFGSAGQIDGWFGLVWTPDGRILYSATTTDGITLSMMSADGSAVKQIVPNGGINTYPSMPADGRFIVFQSNRNGHFAVWRTNPDGSDLKMVSGDQTAGQPFVSPDGKWIVYNSQVNTRGELWRIPAEGGIRFRLTDKPAGWAQISPDSRLVACEIEIDGKAKLGILSLEDGTIAKTFNVPRLANLRLGVHWTPDGRSVSYRDWSNGIWIQPVEGGEPVRVAGLPEEKLFSYGWSPDGKTFAFTRGSTSSDLVLISEAK